MQYSTEFCHTRHCDRLRKELDNITTKNCPEQENTEQVICCVPEGTEPQECTEEKTTFTLTEFKELVHSAQKGDHEAINVLWSLPTCRTGQYRTIIAAAFCGNFVP